MHPKNELYCKLQTLHGHDVSVEVVTKLPAGGDADNRGDSAPVGAEGTRGISVFSSKSCHEP